MVHDGFFSAGGGQTHNGVGRRLRGRRGFVLGARLCRRPAGGDRGPIAARSRAASLCLAGAGAYSGRRRQRLRRSRRHGLAARHRHYDLRRPAARAVELFRLRLRAARPRRHHSTVVRRARRSHSGAAYFEGAVAATAHRRRFGDAWRTCGDRRRGVAHDGPASISGRHAVRRRRQLFRGLRHAAAAVAHLRRCRRWR